MGSSVKLGRIFGVEVGLHWSWLFIFLLVTWSFATGALPDYYPKWSDVHLWFAGAAIAVIFFLSILIHELSHAVVSNRIGLPVRSITLFVFGGVSNLSREPDSAPQEFRIAIVGPAASLALAIAFALGWSVLRQVDDGIAGLSAYLALINASLAVFNILPGYPLDGGRVFRSIVWWRTGDRLRATRSAAHLGGWVAYGLMGLGLVYVLAGGLISGIWLMIIAFFLRNISSSSYEQQLVESALSDLTAADVMIPEFDPVPPEMSLEELIQDHVLRKNVRAFPVIVDDRLLGLISLTDVRKLPREEWATVPVSAAMTPFDELLTATRSENMVNVLQLMASHDVHQIPVVDGTRLLGMLTRAHVLQLIQTRRDLAELTTTPQGETPASKEQRGVDISQPKSIGR